MAMKTDFHDHLISVMDHQLFMAIKSIFNEPWNNFHKKLMSFNEAMKIGKAIFMAMKKIHGFVISISWDCYQTGVGSDIYMPIAECYTCI